MVRFAALFAVVASVAAASAFTLDAYSTYDYAGIDFHTSDAGSHDLSFKARSYRFATSNGDGCCVAFCDGSRQLGYQCGTKNDPSLHPASQFTRVVIGCGSAPSCW